MAGAITCWAVSPSLLLQVLWKYISHIEHIPLGFAFHCSAVSAFQWCPWKPAASLCFGRRGVAPLMEEAYFSCSFCLGGGFFFHFGLDWTCKLQGGLGVLGQRVLGRAWLRPAAPINPVAWVEDCPVIRRWSTLWGMAYARLVPHKTFVQRRIWWKFPF